MFNNLSEKLNGIFAKLTKRGALSESDVTAALREVRIALLEADVALPVVKEFIARVRERAIGSEVLESITPGQQVIKIVHDTIIDILTPADPERLELDLKTKGPAVILMVGLQGSGKTTFTGKLAKHLTDTKKQKCLMASVDIYRPGAKEQLAQLGEKAGIDTLQIQSDEAPLATVKRALAQSTQESYDVLFIDTAGRLQIDADMMAELVAIHQAVNPTETLLAADAMLGQEAVTIVQSFQEQVGLSGILLSRVDGDARGGAALSMVQTTGVPIKFSGVGEDLDALEKFDPERVANRILDQGDVVALVEKAAQAMEEESAAALEKNFEKGIFTLGDMEKQLLQILKMGGMGGIMSMMPGMGQMKDKLQPQGMDDRVIKHQIAIIRAMTPRERRYHKLLNASRRARIAAGSGTTLQAVNRLLKQYQDMQRAMKKFKKIGKKGLMRQGIGSLFGASK